MNEEKLIEECLHHTATRVINEEAGSTAALIRALALALKAEKAKPKLWDDAGVDVLHAQVEYEDRVGNKTWSCHYTRELPKSRERLIAEKYGESLIVTRNIGTTQQNAVNLIEAAILEAKGC